MKVRCACGKTFANAGEHAQHQFNQPAEFCHYRADVKNPQQKKKKKKSPGNKPRIDRRIEEIVRAGLRVFIDIDELAEINIYIEDHHEDRVFMGTYLSLNEAVNAAMDSLVDTGVIKPSFLKRTEQ